jgi:hypothetical protein
MSKYVWMFILCFGSLAGHSQKIKFSDNVAYVDDVAFLKWDLRNGSEISISGLNAPKEEIFALYLDYVDPKQISKGNPEGKVRYIELNFLTLNLKCEIDTRMQKGLVKFIMDNNLYTEGSLNAENVQTTVQKYGMRFSENRPGNVTIQINTN